MVTIFRRRYTPYRDREGNVLIGLSDEDKEYIKLKLGYYLPEEYYTRMFDESYKGLKARVYKQYDKLDVENNIEDFITSKWMLVQPYYK